MTVVLSSSSPLCSVAVSDGDRLVTAERFSPTGASGTLLTLLEQCLAQFNGRIHDVKLFVADVGPGSFIGVRVGVTAAKTLAWSVGAFCAGVTSFDLIAAAGTVVTPSKKGEFFVRNPGETPFRTTERPSNASGYGPESNPESYPMASRALSLIDGLARIEPEQLVPNYLIEPSISTPKKPYRTVEAG